jgi:hypothetical protein
MAALLGVATIFGFLAHHVWRQGFVIDEKSPRANGGLLFFIAAPIGNNIRASVDARVDATGYQDTSRLDLTLSFHGASPGLHWFIVASGQYRPRAKTPLEAFCPGFTRAHRTSAALITCDNRLFEGSQNVAYNSAGHIGSLDGRAIDRISDSLDGYVDADATVISGTLAAGAKNPDTRVTIPIETPTPSRIAGDEYFAYAPIAIKDQGISGSDRLSDRWRSRTRRRRSRRPLPGFPSTTLT